MTKTRKVGENNFGETTGSANGSRREPTELRTNEEQRTDPPPQGK